MIEGCFRDCLWCVAVCWLPLLLGLVAQPEQTCPSPVLWWGPELSRPGGLRVGFWKVSWKAHAVWRCCWGLWAIKCTCKLSLVACWICASFPSPGSSPVICTCAGICCCPFSLWKKVAWLVGGRGGLHCFSEPKWVMAILLLLTASGALNYLIWIWRTRSLEERTFRNSVLIPLKDVKEITICPGS